MVTPKGRRVALTTGLLALLAIASGTILGWAKLEDWYSRKIVRGETTYRGNPDKRGKRVLISEGRFPVEEFLQFLSDYTCLPLVYYSKDPGMAAPEIEIAAEISEADDAVVKAILEFNGLHVIQESLPDGSEVMKIEPIPHQ
jgi:hypothetical protein